MNINQEGIAKLGAFAKQELGAFINDRALIEQQMLRNLRQYLGKYDPSDYVTYENFNPLDHTTTYRPAQREGY